MRLFDQEADMTNKESKKPESPEKSGLGRITRRAFTIGSVAAISTGPLSKGNADVDPPPFKLEMTEAAYQIMVDRHILESDLIQVIQYAEETGDKLYQTDSDRFLAKLKLNTVYFYAEYSPVEGGYRIHNTYSHRFTLEGTM